MKPQPPVTNMRIAQPSSSVAEAAPLVSPATVGARVDEWIARSREIDWTPWVIVGLGAFLRFFLLGIKPPHFDEGINGWFVDQMVKSGFYKYDPTNYHGPLHFYILFICQTLLGRNVWAIRLPVVLASIFSIHLTMKFEPFVGRNVSRIAALAMAVSPGFVFYGRYSIHEVWLLLFSMLFILGLLGLWQRGTVNYLWCAGMGLAGMILTKETYIIHVGCAVAAAVVTWISHKFNRMPDAKRVRQTWTWLDLFVLTITGIAAIIFFYSGTFLNWPGVEGLWKTFDAWFKTGSQGAGHEKESWYWLMLIGRYEQPVALALLLLASLSVFEFVKYRGVYFSFPVAILLLWLINMFIRPEWVLPWSVIWMLLLGFVLCVGCQFLKHASLRYLAIYAVGTLIAYSIVKYKTPWCIISMVWPLLFVFGALAGLMPAVFRRGALIVVAVVLTISLALSVRLNYFRCTTETEPYVYVQTYNDIWKLTKPLLRLAKSNPTYYQLIGHLIRTSTYPLPWMLGDFTKVGYYEHNNMPEKLDGDFLLVQSDKIDEVEAKLHETYYTEPMTIRQYQDWSKLYFNAKVFAKLFPGRVPEFTGKPAPQATPPK
jgi:uncharacterized protein (TIGR03663 family)